MLTICIVTGWIKMSIGFLDNVIRLIQKLSDKLPSEESANSKALTLNQKSISVFSRIVRVGYIVVLGVKVPVVMEPIHYGFFLIRRFTGDSAAKEANEARWLRSVGLNTRRA